MNDAVAITLFRTTGKFVGVQIGAEEGFIAFVDFVLSFVGSVIIGYVLGLFSAWIFKTIDMSHHRLVLVSVFVGMVYIPFFLAEALQLSGIVTILFGAITARRYSAQNMPPGVSLFVFFLILLSYSLFIYLLGKTSCCFCVRNPCIYFRNCCFPLHWFKCLFKSKCKKLSRWIYYLDFILYYCWTCMSCLSTYGLGKFILFLLSFILYYY